MKKRIGIALVAVFLTVTGTLAATGWAYAAHDEDAGGGRFTQIEDGSFVRGTLRHRLQNHIAQALELTDEQKRQLEAIFASERPNIAPLIQQLSQTHRQMRAADANGQFNEEQVRTIAAQQAQTITELIVAKERVQSRIYGVLTPEQRVKAERIRERLETMVQSRLQDAGLLNNDQAR